MSLNLWLILTRAHYCQKQQTGAPTSFTFKVPVLDQMNEYKLTNEEFILGFKSGLPVQFPIPLSHHITASLVVVPLPETLHSSVVPSSYTVVWSKFHRMPLHLRVLSYIVTEILPGSGTAEYLTCHVTGKLNSNSFGFCMSNFHFCGTLAKVIRMVEPTE